MGVSEIDSTTSERLVAQVHAESSRTRLFPRSLAVGDFDRDGHTDLATINTGTNDVSVLLGLGDGTFAPGQHFAVGRGPQDLMAGDFNGDGHADLASANTDSHDVSVLLGRGDGTFAPGQRFNVGSIPVGIVAGDFNGDGRTDLAFANTGSNDVSVLLGRGDGTFAPQSRFFLGFPSDVLRPFDPVAGDFNGDGRTDLATANADSNNVSVLLSWGDGTFELSPQQLTVGKTPTGIVSDDFNGDGRVDLITTSGNSNDISVLLGLGNGTFAPAHRFEVGLGPQDMVVGDFNGDRRTDLAAVNAGSNDVSVLLGRGDGTFAPEQRYAVGWNPSALGIGDFNGDGQLDLAATNGGSDDVSILQGSSDGTFGSVLRPTVGLGPQGMVTGDFNGAGLLEPLPGQDGPSPPIPIPDPRQIDPGALADGSGGSSGFDPETGEAGRLSPTPIDFSDPPDLGETPSPSPGDPTAPGNELAAITLDDLMIPGLAPGDETDPSTGTDFFPLPISSLAFIVTLLTDGAGEAETTGTDTETAERDEVAAVRGDAPLIDFVIGVDDRLADGVHRPADPEPDARGLAALDRVLNRWLSAVAGESGRTRDLVVRALRQGSRSVVTAVSPRLSPMRESLRELMADAAPAADATGPDLGAAIGLLPDGADRPDGPRPDDAPGGIAMSDYAAAAIVLVGVAGASHRRDRQVAARSRREGHAAPHSGCDDRSPRIPRPWLLPRHNR